MRSWNSAVRSVVVAIARSTCVSPRTVRRIFMPAACRSFSSIEGTSLRLFLRAAVRAGMPGQDPIDERVRDAEIPIGGQALRDFALVEMPSHHRIAAENLGERAMLGCRTPDGCLDARMSLAPAERSGERHHHRFGKDHV